jgi:hypothetical protein
VRKQTWHNNKHRSKKSSSLRLEEVHVKTQKQLP